MKNQKLKTTFSRKCGETQETGPLRGGLAGVIEHVMTKQDNTKIEHVKT